MQINVSKFSDFCFGVKRAIKIAKGTLKGKKGPVYSLGPIIHNKEVVDELYLKGLTVIDGDLSKIEKGTIVICSHGVHPDRFKRVKNSVAIIDATCPFVKNAQKIAQKLFLGGYKVIIIGDKGHPEVKTLKKFTENKAIVISDLKEVKKRKIPDGKVGIIAQTTQSNKKFDRIVDSLFNKGLKEVRVYKTICRDADTRQKSTQTMSLENDIMIIVGGKNSANTRRLYEICKSYGKKARHIENASELKKEWFSGVKSIGVASGASTPKWVVAKVVSKLRRMH